MVVVVVVVTVGMVDGSITKMFATATKSIVTFDLFLFSSSILRYEPRSKFNFANTGQIIKSFRKSKNHHILFAYRYTTKSIELMRRKQTPL